jgi:hypothetical protein
MELVLIRKLRVCDSVLCFLPAVGELAYRLILNVNSFLDKMISDIPHSLRIDIHTDYTVNLCLGMMKMLLSPVVDLIVSALIAVSVCAVILRCVSDISIPVLLASTLLVLVLQRLEVTVAGVYRQLLYRHCSEPLEPRAAVDRATRARKTVHIYGARARA